MGHKTQHRPESEAATKSRESVETRRENQQLRRQVRTLRKQLEKLTQGRVVEALEAPPESLGETEGQLPTPDADTCPECGQGLKAMVLPTGTTLKACAGCKYRVSVRYSR